MIRPRLLIGLLASAVLYGQEPPRPAEKPQEKPPVAGSNGQGKDKPAPVTGQKDPGKDGKSDKPIDKPADKPADQPVPRGSDPADLRAIQSAQKMIEQEKKLAQLIKEGKITGLDKVLSFDELTSWPYEDGLKGMPKAVRELDKKKVMMTGFMLPIDEVQNIKEFLLVQSLWSCCYGQPPDINGIVRVVMPKGKTTDYFFDPVKIIGTFKVEATVLDGYCVDIFQLQVESLEPLR